MLLFTLLLCLMLCGCGQSVPHAETMPIQASIAAEVPIHLQEAANDLELRYGDALQVEPLTLRNVRGLFATEEGVLLISGYGETTLTLLDEKNMQEIAQLVLPFSLNPEDPSLQIRESGISYFDPEQRILQILDNQLNPIHSISAGTDWIDTPLLSEDAQTVYYCTETAIRALDVESGISRCLKSLSYRQQTLTGLHMEDTVLQCRTSDGDTVHTLFLSTDTGSQLAAFPREITVDSLENRFYASFSDGLYQVLVFGHTGEDPKTLQPEEWNAPCTFLPRHHAAVLTAPLSEDEIQLEYYDLDTGICLDVLPLDVFHTPICITTQEDGTVCFLIYDPESDCHFLCNWDVSKMALSYPDTAAPSYTGPYYSAQNPDKKALAACQSYADEIGQQHGIDILVWEDAAAVQPWDYVFEAEYLPRILMEELEALEQRLSVYPQGFLEETASHFTSLKLCLVRSISGSPESGSLNKATGIQFFDGSDAYVVIAAGEYAGHALYHELFHVMETHILTNSTALDRWEALNPAGFSYDYSYLTNATRDSGVYLSGENRAFIDTYSMSYPKEDRARLMEYAILPGNELLFHSRTMQQKLDALCDGIREAYHLESPKRAYIWEQYLQ